MCVHVCMQVSTCCVGCLWRTEARRSPGTRVTGSCKWLRTELWSSGRTARASLFKSFSSSWAVSQARTAFFYMSAVVILAFCYGSLGCILGAKINFCETNFEDRYSAFITKPAISWAASYSPVLGDIILPHLFSYPYHPCTTGPDEACSRHWGLKIFSKSHTHLVLYPLPAHGFLCGSLCDVCLHTCLSPL